ncbi:MAG: PD-(D/E)XK nuclease domain-containing protein, partial [Lachnospiraceae bacterium]|nr:PD-(D/E)XK nuclease domain-containing protein [Lachnospiraceae bacterium]
FGFTKEEVREILKYYNVNDKYEEVCEWYDGYLFGNTEIFNPWSVINYIENDCFPKAFWQSTGSNDIIGEVIACATPEITEELHKLLSGQNITTFIDTSVIYPEVQNNPYSIYSFLLVAGYLKVSKIYPQHDGNFMCEVGIPNKEISYVYEKEVLNKTNQNVAAISISQAIFSGDTEKLQKQLDQFMIESISSFDTVNEGFYHGMMLGLCAVLSNRYQVRSNRESGLGRFDIMLIPRVKAIPAFIYEFKYTKDEKADLDVLANEALKQIEDKKYDTELSDFGVDNIVKIGIAFRGKTVAVRK